MGSDRKSNDRSGNGDAGVTVQIPASSKKVVQSLKEVVGNKCTDSEIYAALCECNMDPNDAVQRLISQDTFHKVKGKRERRKEMKGTQELKTRANNFGIRELGKTAYRKENGSVASIPHSGSALVATRQTLKEPSCPQSSFYIGDHRRQSVVTGDMIDSSFQQSTRSQSSLAGTNLGYVTMADIVRLGRPHSKGSQMPETSFPPQDMIHPKSAINQMKPSHGISISQLKTPPDLHSSDLDVNCELRRKPSQLDLDNELPENEPITSSRDVGTLHSNQSYLHRDRANLPNNSSSDSILVSESDADQENLSYHHASSAQASSEHILDGSGGAPKHSDGVFKSTTIPDSYQHYEHPEGRGGGSHLSVPYNTGSDDIGKAVSLASVNLEHLSLMKERTLVTPTESNQGVVLPDHLQAFSADCLHLNFGTYKSGNRTSFSRLQASGSSTNGLDDNFTVANALPALHSDSRNSVHHEEQLAFDTQGANLQSKFSLAELRKLEIPDPAAPWNDCVPPSSIPDFGYKKIPQSYPVLSSEFAPSARSFHPDNQSDVVLNPGAFPITRPSAQGLHGANLTTGPVLKEHPEHCYSQTGYRNMPQGHAYAPSAFQQAYPNGSLFNESLLGMKYNLPQYRNGRMNGLHLPDSYASGFESLGNSTNIPANFLDNLSAGPAGSKVRHDGSLSSRYGNGGANFNLPQQYHNESSALWESRRGSKTLSTVPDGSYYSLEGQNQVLARYQQGQQHAQYHRALGHPSTYNAQAGLTREQQLLQQWQQQDLLDIVSNGSLSPSSKQLPQNLRRWY